MSNPSISPAPAQTKQQRSGTVDAQNITLDVAPRTPSERPLAVSHLSTPAYHSPLRHHRRESSRNAQVKETFNAKSHYGSSSDDGGYVHKINQYIIKQEIGRGSFGSVHLAVDQYGTEFAVKEFSKSRLRKRAQSDLLRRPSRRKKSASASPSGGLNSPLHRHTSDDKVQGDSDNAFDLIRGEIAVMKKLNHPNLVGLIEVLDDPDEDSLYMVLEMCKKGVVMKVGLDETADPYDEETCRYWFRDMCLGLEYLHAQGIIHRDLKPDNCLITEDDVLKIVDFGVSEMFDKQSDMHISKSAGSPAFMPPELCVARHGNVSGRAVDIWSMGVTLYCLRYGKIPFEKDNMLDLYQAIRQDELQLRSDDNPDCQDLLRRMLTKDPAQRINMREIKAHPWVTKNGQDPLLSEEENCHVIIAYPTEEEVKHAITGNMGHVMAVAKAVKRFKNLLIRKRPELMEGIFGRSSRIVRPPGSIRHDYGPNSGAYRSRSIDTDDRQPLEGALAAEGVHHHLQVDKFGRVHPKHADSLGKVDEPDHPPQEEQHPSERPESTEASPQRTSTDPQQHRHNTRNFSPDDNGRGHAHDPLRDTLYLKVGIGPEHAAVNEPTPEPMVCESPGGVEGNIYEKAYEQEMDRIEQDKGRNTTMYLTRRVDHREDYAQREGVQAAKPHLRDPSGGGDKLKTMLGGMSGGNKGLMGMAQRLREKEGGEGESEDAEGETEDEQGKQE